jgi:hypothetical protein
MVARVLFTTENLPRATQESPPIRFQGTITSNLPVKDSPLKMSQDVFKKRIQTDSRNDEITSET